MTAPKDPLSDRLCDSFLLLEDALDGWTQTYRQLTPGAFRGRVTTLDLGSVTISRERVNLGVENWYRVPGGRVAIAFQMSTAIVHGTQGDFGAGEGLVTRAGEDHAVYSEAGGDVLIVTVEDALIDADLRSGQRLRGSATDGLAPWLSGILHTCGAGLARPELLSVVPDLILGRLLPLFDCPAAPGPAARSAAVFDEIVQAIDTLEPEELTVADLSRRLCRDRATLRAASRDMAGLPLDDFLLARRLSDAYRALWSGDPGSLTVTGVALSHGFAHLGRFATRYRAMFAEAPSETLKRRVSAPLQPA